MVIKSYNNKLLIIGVILFLLYILQYTLELRWQWLYNIQIEEGYKRWSGLLLGLFILWQWVLTIVRISKKIRHYSNKFTKIHKYLGVFSPVLFYFHAMEFGYGYLALLSYIFFVNMILGTINLDIIKSTKDWIFRWWMIAHVAFSVMITFISIFHIGVVFYYK